MISQALVAIDFVGANFLNTEPAVTGRNSAAKMRESS